MEAGTVAPAAASTGSKTIADLVALAAERYGADEAQRYKRDGEWHSVSYEELGRDRLRDRARPDRPRHRARRPGRRSCARTRPEWTSCDFAISSAGAVVVPIYPTNSPGECEWVAGNSESRGGRLRGRRAGREDRRGPRQPARRSRHVIVVDPAGDVDDAITLDDLRERGRGRDEAELRARAAAVTPDDTYTIIYTSGTTGPPKGCVLTHGNYRQVVNMCEEEGVVEAGDVVYLFLPLAHAFALLIQLLAIDLGSAIAYWGGDPKKIIPELMEVKPTYLPSVPRIFEKIYTLVTVATATPSRSRAPSSVGLKVRALQAAGQEVPAELQAAFDQADEALFKNVRGVFGGRITQAVTGAAPIAQEILEFFYACGVPVMEGYGMTETSTVGDDLEPSTTLRFGSVGQAAARRRGQDRRGRRGPDQGPEHLPAATTRTTTPASGRSSTAGCTPATSARSTRTASSSSPAARRTSSSPRAARTSRRPTSRTTSSSTAGSRRP